MKKFKRSKATGFFDEDFRLSKLTQLGDPLERLSAGIDFEMFREVLTDKLQAEPKGKGGRKHHYCYEGRQRIRPCSGIWQNGEMG